MTANMAEINESLHEITALVGEIAKAMEGMGKSAENSNTNSEAVLSQMEELFRLSEMLNQTVSSFRV